MEERRKIREREREKAKEEARTNGAAFNSKAKNGT